MGFEPTRAEHIGLAVQRLNHSATSSLKWKDEIYYELDILYQGFNSNISSNNVSKNCVVISQ